VDDTFVNHLCPLGPEFLLSVLRLSALTTCGKFSGTPLDLLPFLKTVEKGATTLVLFAYAMYAMLYLLLPSGAYFLLPSGVYIHVLYLCGTFCEAYC